MMDPISYLEYQQFHQFLERNCGVTLGENKEYFVRYRLDRMIGQQGITSLKQLLELIENDDKSPLHHAVIDAMMTNKTAWFRDHYPFEIVAKVIFPKWEQQGLEQRRIWSAACSSGQEPYTISISLSDYLKTQRKSHLTDIEIVASDLSEKMLTLAKQAKYEEKNLVEQGVTESQLTTHFQPVESQHWHVKPEISERIIFKKHNLLTSYVALGQFDLIFCRNVLIYFSVERKIDVIHRIAKALKPGGFLILGASEVLSGYTDIFEMVKSPYGFLYQLKS